MKILVADAFPKDRLADFAALGLTVDARPDASAKELPAAALDATVLVVRSKQVQAEVFQGAPALSLVVRAGAGVNTIDEVKGIDRLFREGNREGKTLLRAEARESYAKGQAMERYGYIHFSMHGILAPGYQAIAFSQLPGEGEDGLLTLGEIMNLRYNARLVVLSACQTGLGRAERGEGVTGLTRAVMYAGSPAAVVSLWSVDDRGTRELMTRFYENMIRKEAPKAQALRTAKREMIKTRWRHPYFWAAFVMYGE